MSTLVETGQPAAGGLAARKKERTRVQLAEAAADLFYRYGYHATTIDDIAAAVDVSPRTFFRYFPTKEDLVVALGTTSLVSFLTALKGRPPAEPLLAAVAAAVDEALAPGWEDTAQVRSFLALIRDTPALRARWIDEAFNKRHLLAAVIATRTDGDPDGLRNLLVAGAVTLAINTALQRWADQDAESSPTALVHQALAELAQPLLTP